jgi:hypothetical protein
LRFLVDSVAWEALPVNIGMVGGYVNGARSQWPHVAWQRFPNSKHVRINVTGAPNRGNCLDVEAGDATPSDAPVWYDSVTWCPKQDLAVYCNRSNVQNVIQAMGNRPWHLWLSTLDGTKLTVIDGKRVAACQFLGEIVLGVNMDLSEVYDDSWLKG